MLHEMKDIELYRKYKTHYPPVENLFSRANWIQTVLVTLGAILVEPLIMYKKYRRTIPFTQDYYFHQVEYFLLILIPIGLIYLWFNWRESVKRRRGYCWVGKFEVIEKHASFLFYYFTLSPGENHKLKVSRKLFHKTHLGDHIVIRRDPLGHIEKISRMKKFATRLRKIRPMGF